MPGIIDDFEDGDIAEYGGNTGDYDVQTGTVYNGSYAAHSTATSGWSTISDTGPTLQNDGTTYSGWVQTDLNNRTGFLFFTQSEASTPDAYHVCYDSSALELRYFSGGSPNTISSTSVSVSSYTWYKLEWSVDSSGNHSVAMYDTNGNTVGSLSATDTTYTSGGVGLANWNTDGYYDYIVNHGTPSPPSNLSASTYDNSRIDLSWTDNSDDEDGFNIYRAQSSGSALSDYTKVDSVGANTTNYSDTGLLDGERYYYRVTAYNSNGESDPSNEADSTTDLPAPSGVSATINANDSIDVSWTDNSDNEDHFYVRVSRDGAAYSDPSGGPTTPAGDSDTGDTHSANYNPNSDNSYNSQVGIDSSFKFRIYAETIHTASGVAYSGTVYTDPIPPHNPSVSRADGNSIAISWANQSDIEDGVEVQYREDSGSGYGAWTTATTTAAGATSWSTSSLPTDVRRQWRVRTVAPDGGTSAWVYADYGNAGNVYFSDDFEDQDLAEWDTTSLGDADSGIQSGSVADLGISGADQGTYYCRLDAGDYIQKNLGDLSGASNVIVKVAVATGSMDSSSEETSIKWYDGTAWNTLQTFGWEYNKQGWAEVTALVPSSYLSTDNRVVFEGYGGGGDHFAVDRVVVSDILHEYTTPGAPSSLSFDTTIEDEITASWTNNHTFADDIKAAIKRTSDSSYSIDATLTAGTTSHTYTALDDGERYDMSIRPRVAQDRNGAYSQSWFGPTTGAATALLPAPTTLSVDAVNGDQADLSWTVNHDYGWQRVEVKPTDQTAWAVEADDLGRATSTLTTSHLLAGEQYDIRVLAVTEHTETTDA